MPVISSDAQTLILPYPLRLPRQYGVYSLNANGRPFSTRLHDDDVELLRVEAAHIAMSPTALCRWLVVHGVQQMALLRTGTAPVVRP